VANSSTWEPVTKVPPHPSSLPPEDELGALRRLLVGPEQRALRKLQERLDRFTLQAKDVSQVLPEAILLRSTQDQHLSKVLTPVVETTLQHSLKTTPQIWIDALFPVIGPTIRRAIAHVLRGMLESLNQTLEQSLSLRGLRWRWEAWRTGKPFAEIVILRTLRYRVEQVFLIHNYTGLLLQHVLAGAVSAPDADLVAGMLTAIQDFVQDSFGEDRGPGLETVQLGELTIWLERGAKATLAGVIRGNAPQELRAVFQDALESIHLQQGSLLDAFQGDATPFAASRSALESCLQVQLESKKPQSFLLWKLLAGALLVALGVWLFFTVRDNLRWAAYLTRLNAEQGIVVTMAEKRQGKYFIAGLRDPLAVDPTSLLLTTGLNPEKVVSRWEPYHALYPDFILTRAIAVLAPPATVRLSMTDTVLSATGSARHQWIVDAQKLARAIPGVTAFTTEHLVDLDQLWTEELQAATKRVEQSVLYFVVDSNHLVPNEQQKLDQLVAGLKTLYDVAQKLGKRIRVEIVGHTDTTGTEQKNQRLSQDRAEVVLSMLADSGLPTSGLKAVGVGARVPLRNELSESDRAVNRRVTFTVIPVDAAQAN
jgi:outer membrane protein OmpA-like peptidoglycan-associated protein